MKGADITHQGLTMPIPFWKKSGAGFTLLELMVTIAITGILTAMIFFDYGKERFRDNLKAAVRQVQVDLQAMQTKAQAGVVLPGTSLVPNGYGFTIASNGASAYTLFGDTLVCSGNGTTPCNTLSDCTVAGGTCTSGTALRYNASDITLQTRTLPGSGDVLFRVLSQTDIVFTRPNGAAVTFPAVSPTTICLRSTKLGICYAITVTTPVGTVSSRQITSCAACP